MTHSHVAGDSAGVPWVGRHLTDTGFETDTGAADPAVQAVLAEFGETGDIASVLTALAGSRLLIPIVAVLGEGSQARAVGPGKVELSADKSADLAMVSIQAPDGRRAMPAFTSLATLTAWNPQARPVPVPARRAALAAVEEECELIVVDPAGPTTVVLPRPAVWALAQGHAWQPSHQDSEVAATVTRVLTGLPHLVEVSIAQGKRAELAVRLRLTPGLTQPQVDELVTAVSERLAASEVVAQRVDSLELALRG